MTIFPNLMAMQRHILKVRTHTKYLVIVLIISEHARCPKYHLPNTDQCLFCRPRRASVDKESYLKYVSKRRVGGGGEIGGVGQGEGGEEEGEGRTAVDCTSVLRTVLRKGSFRLVIIP